MQWQAALGGEFRVLVLAGRPVLGPGFRAYAGLPRDGVVALAVLVPLGSGTDKPAVNGRGVFGNLPHDQRGRE